MTLTEPVSELPILNFFVCGYVMFLVCGYVMYFEVFKIYIKSNSH